MQEHGIYFGKSNFFELVRTVGGVWNDSKERPLVCLIRSVENENLYWAIPITDKYIEREYKGKYTGEPYVIKNKVLLSELKRKLGRILTWENTSPNSFRQHITDVKIYLLEELNRQEKECVTPFPTQSPHQLM